MSPKNKFWWFAGVSLFITCCVMVVIGILFFKQLSAEEVQTFLSVMKRNAAYVFIGFIIIMAGIGFGLDGIFHNYILPMHKMAEETELILNANPSHRIRIEGSRDVLRLAQAINQGADLIENLQKDVKQRIAEAKAEAEEEKNILAAFMAELPEGVMVCNAEGRILLYNRHARLFLGHPGMDTQNSMAPHERHPVDFKEKFVGLGRSIFGVIDKHLIVHALDEIAEKLRRGESDVASYFVVIGTDNRLLRAEAVPVLNQDRKFTGFILILYDITRQLKIDQQMEEILKAFTTGIRTSLTGIRSAIEAIVDYPNMDKQRLQNFHQLIHGETESLTQLLKDAAVDTSIRTTNQWPLVQMADVDLVETIRGKASEKLHITVHTSNDADTHWVRIDTYSMLMAVLFVLSRLVQETGCDTFTCRRRRQGRFVNLDMIWQGRAVKPDVLKKWYNSRIQVGDEQFPLTLKEVLGHHHADIWSHSCEDGQCQAYLRILLPIMESAEADNIRNMMIVTESRPEFYDFDLFNQPGQNPELDNRLLKDLTYTVFDTETTGLDPRGGDEIISIGAIRIVNGHILHDEIFDQLVDPRRPLPKESIKIHGILPNMLKNQPAIDQVLPVFHKFAEDTILVAHNAAFDMRMLEMKEKQTGIRFINPVLDTLLLSAVVHPAQENHTLEHIAKRLGISIAGRHTALGDAITTAEIFLKMIDLLGNIGIRTLKQAREASRKSYYARLKY